MLSTHDSKMQEIIAILKSLDINGEVMQYIIEELSLIQETIRELINTYPTTCTKEIINYKQQFKTNIAERSINYPLSKSQEVKLDIISNYIEYFSSDDLEREMMLDNAFFYVVDDHANELDNLIK